MDFGHQYGVRVALSGWLQLPQGTPRPWQINTQEVETRQEVLKFLLLDGYLNLLSILILSRL
jgi:hypothetical protein